MVVSLAWHMASIQAGMQCYLATLGGEDFWPPVQSHHPWSKLQLQSSIANNLHVHELRAYGIPTHQALFEECN